MDHTSCYSTHQTPYHSALGWLDACKVSIVTRKTTHYTWELPPYCTLVKAMYSAPLLNNKLHDSHRRIVYIIPDTAPRSTPRRSRTQLCVCALHFTHRYRWVLARSLLSSTEMLAAPGTSDLVLGHTSTTNNIPCKLFLPPIP